MFQLYDDTVIYIFCPSKTTTGGPEALHQLCDAINLQGGNAKMVYVHYGFEKIVKSPKPLQYWMYCSNATLIVNDNSRNIAIVPEIWPHLLNKYQHIQKAVWWLSVNYLREEKVLGEKEFQHLYQSSYARNFLLANGIESPEPLYDYLNVPVKKKDTGKHRSAIIPRRA